MKRYWVFAGWDYYPLGGFNDFDSDYDCLETAKVRGEFLIKEKKFGYEKDWYQILDTNSGDIIKC